MQPLPTPAPTNITYTVSGETLVLQSPDGAGWQLQAWTNGLSVGLNPASNAWFTVIGASPYANMISPTNPAEWRADGGSGIVEMMSNDARPRREPKMPESVGA